MLSFSSKPSVGESSGPDGAPRQTRKLISGQKPIFQRNQQQEGFLIWKDHSTEEGRSGPDGARADKPLHQGSQWPSEGEGREGLPRRSMEARKMRYISSEDKRHN
ncbi:hypothetical protein CEXT_142731 [Caerostris extrusa]|uniref:Uncharacterized protein n=1 Tax=Caerostris extrusa TaxID=172846 RepID=A0AAV4UMH8_CAEEX|nr:hypothetical protein CEXT_142731 [Caerostris extrusa]